MDITFTNINGASEDFRPYPASKNIPDWYSKMAPYMNKVGHPFTEGKKEGPTIKKCMPVFDAITAGYIIPTPVDLYIGKEGKEFSIQWPSLDFIKFHEKSQAPDYPNSNNSHFPKFMNPWAIKTPPGYSCLFVQPFHRSSVFSILPGVVDTDKYSSLINFPFVLTDQTFEGIIPAGTPMVQVIPFKRDTWKSKWGGEKEKEEFRQLTKRMRSIFLNGYKTLYRSKKEYL